MSLINQMLRDLEQRRGGTSPPALPERQRERAEGDPPRRLPPVSSLGLGLTGTAGLALLWGLSGWLSSPPAPGPTPAPGPVALARPAAPAPAPAAPRPTAAPAAPAPPTPARVIRPPSSAAAPALPSPAPSVAAPVAGEPRASFVTPLPARMAASASAAPSRPHLHPDLLPGAVSLRPAPPASAPETPYARAEAAYREGLADYQENRSDRSLAALRRALTAYPGHLLARELLADQLELAGHGTEALAALQQGLEIAPDYAPFRKRAARILLDRGAAAEASGVLTGRGLPRIDADPELHILLATAYRRLGEHFLEAQTYRNLLVRYPRDGALWVGLGSALQAGGQPEDARQAYRQALAAGGLSRDLAAKATAALNGR